MPPVGIVPTVIVPFDPPLQLTLVDVITGAVKVLGWVMVMLLELLVQPLASLLVTA